MNIGVTERGASERIWRCGQPISVQQVQCPRGCAVHRLSTDCHTIRTTMAKPKPGSEDVLSLLDSLGDTAAPADTPQDPSQSENEKELLGFLDDLVKQPSRSQTPRPTAAAAAPTRTSRELVSTPVKKTPEKPSDAPAVSTESSPSKGEGGWFGGLWNMGSAAVKSAEMKVKELQQTDEAKAWEERVRENVSVLGKLSTSSNRPFTHPKTDCPRERPAGAYFAFIVIHTYIRPQHDCASN